MAQQIIGGVFLTDPAATLVLLVAKPCRTVEQTEKEGEVSGKERTWPKFPWKTHLSVGWRASPVFSKAPYSRRIQPTLAQGCCLLLVPGAVGHCGVSRGRAELHPVYDSRSGMRRGDFCSLVGFTSVLCRAEVMTTMTRTKDDRCDEVRAILKRFVLNG